MNYLRFTQYVYLVFGLYFVYYAFTQWQAGESPWLSLIIAAVAVFMFFFRRKFATKFDNRDNKDKP